MNSLQGDLNVTGQVICGGITLPSNAIGNAQVNAASPLGVTKTIHQYIKEYAQAFASNATSVRIALHSVIGTTATVVSFFAGSTTAALTTATCTFDLYKNGSSILSATIIITNSNMAYQQVTAAIATAGCTTGDCLEAVITAAASGGTLAKGIFCGVVIDETSQ